MSTELTGLKGIGAKTAEALGRLGINSAEELIDFYPRDYERFSEPVPVYELVPGEVVSVRGTLQRPPVQHRYNGQSIVNAYLTDLTGNLQLSWFNAPYIKNALSVGRPLVFRGRVSEKNGRIFLTQPKIFDAAVYESEYLSRIMPIYPLTRGLTQKSIMSAAAEALRTLPPKKEFLPEELLEAYSLMPLHEASRAIHFPKDGEELAAARRRLIFDEFLTHILAGRLFAQDIMRAESHCRCRPDWRLIGLIAALPYELTAAQKRAWREITADMNSSRVMNRLIEGDVGSGKTIVAMLAMLHAALSGYQAVLLAPTAVLAAQHMESMNMLLGLLHELDPNAPGVRAVLLTGGGSQAERADIRREIASHEADIIIGTHALFQERVEYGALGLVVTDEQHRFGVSQREAIFHKGDMPHMLIMSATPIPRTLSLILYSGMDVSLIDEKPEGRLPVQSAVIGPSDRETAYKFIYGQIKKGARAYVICPAIDEAEEEDESLENVTEYAKKLRKIFPPSVRIASLHGRMKEEDKSLVMEAFRRGDADILVSTTVVEVGVDVREASVMLIENAERYGLATLHQLRGRVGRGERPSYCMLVNTSGSEKAAERLRVLCASCDGFRIAEEDLRLRGPGDMFGLRQSGEMAFTLGDIYRDRDELELAGKVADELLREDPGLNESAHGALCEKVRSLMAVGSVL